jgi:hypothetical protein
MRSGAAQIKAFRLVDLQGSKLSPWHVSKLEIWRPRRRPAGELITSSAASPVNTPFWVPRNAAILSKPILLTFLAAASIA